MNNNLCFTSFMSWLIVGRVCVCLYLAEAQFLYYTNRLKLNKCVNRYCLKLLGNQIDFICS